MATLAWRQSPVVRVEGGQILGVPSASEGITVFKGIPYAAPPVGDLRWKRPQPVAKWKGVRKADTFSNICWQPGNAVGTFYGNEFYWKENTVPSEDCLYLNVWTPADAIGHQDRKLPVAFWVHGGAYFNGYGHEITMDGDSWAKRGVILVTINYRLGIFGFLAHPELSKENSDGTSGNYGTYDQIAALRWVHENIAQFGGDPDNITVLGQSAGAASIKNLVSSPLSKHYIRNAIIQSGGGISEQAGSDGGQKEAEDKGKAFMDKFGYNNLKKMRKAPAEELLRIFKAEGMGLFRLHIDGVLLKESFDDAARNCHLADASYMIGCTLDDIRPMGKQIDAFCFLRDSLDNRPAYQYLFARKLPGTHDGAFHSAELWYMFHTLSRSWRPMTEADIRLADEVMDYWTNFAKYGPPNRPGSESWHPFTLANPFVMTLNIKYSNEIVADGETPVKVSDLFSFTEGPAADAMGNVYFTDQPNNKIYRWDCQSGEITLFTDQSGRSNGMYFDAQGKLIACADMDNQLWAFDMKGHSQILVTDYRGKLLNSPNDVWISKDGSCYLTDPYFKRDYWARSPERQQPAEGLYYLAPGGKQLVMLDSTLNQPNGIVGTPYGKHLYVAEAKANRILKYNIQTDGSLSNRQVFANMGSDGMTIDDRGNIYLTGDGVTVFNKDGQKIAHFPIPEDWTANVCFGGKERDVLFITASKSVYTLKMLVHGVK